MQVTTASSAPFHSGRLQPPRPFEDRAVVDSVTLNSAPTQGDGLPNAQPFRLFHDLRVQLDADNGYMRAEDRMSVSRIPDNGKVVFLLHPNLKVKEILCQTDPVPFQRQDDAVCVDLRRYCDPGMPTRLRVKYCGPIPGDENAAGAKGVYMYDENFWHPNHLGEHSRSRLIVSMPQTWNGTASADEQGTAIDDQGNRVIGWETPWAGTGLSLAVANYQTRESDRDGRHLRTFLFPESKTDANDVMDRSARIIKFFEPLFGPFPYDHLDVCESTTKGAGGVPSVVLFQPGLLDNKAAADNLLSHQISHNWWAGTLAGYSNQGLWYEAFAEFSSNLYCVGMNDSESAQAQRKEVLTTWRDQVGQDGSVSLRDCNSYDDSLVASKKGAFVLSMLRDKVGDDSFFGGMRQFVNDNQGRLVDWVDAQEAFESSSGQDLSTFFGQWLDRTDAPSLGLRGMNTTAVDGGYKLSGKLAQLQDGDPYDLSVPLVIRTANGDVKKKIDIKNGEETFEFTLPAAPQEVTIDPDLRLFRLLSKDESWQAPAAVPTTLTC